MTIIRHVRSDYPYRRLINTCTEFVHSCTTVCCVIIVVLHIKLWYNKKKIGILPYFILHKDEPKCPGRPIPAAKINHPLSYNYQLPSGDD